MLPSHPMKPWATFLTIAISAAMTNMTAFAAPDATRLPDATSNNTNTTQASALALPPSPKLVQEGQDAIQNYIATKADQLKTAGQTVSKTANTVGDKTSDIVLSAMGFLGVPYRRGGSSFETGFDCSGFVHALFEQTVGLALPRVAKQQAQATQVIAKSDLKPGDLVFFNTMRRAFSHVGIYIGDNKFIHSPRTGAEIRIEDMSVSYWQRRFNGARRVDLPPEATTVALSAAASAANSNSPAAFSTVVNKDIASAAPLNTPTSLTLAAALAASPLKSEAVSKSSGSPNAAPSTTAQTPTLKLKPSKDLTSSGL